MDIILFTIGGFTIGLILGVCFGTGFLDHYGIR